jgi:SagB-type dehydrogenase family enzyme
MNKNLQTILHYHETTKHHQHKYARSLGYMDWSTQPDPFRKYNTSKKIALPLALGHTTPPYHLLGTDAVPSAPLCMESISQLMQFSMAIAAWKTTGVDSWAVRCNASSGNLHPTESYLILPPLQQNAKNTLVTHYTPKDHELEILAEFKTDFWKNLPNGSFLISLSSISWREVWKYGERAFRYVQLDAGHAWQSIVVSAAMLGWSIKKLDTISDEQIEKILGLNQKGRFFEDENADMLLVVSPKELDNEIDIQALDDDLPLKYEGMANKLSPSMYKWDIIPTIEEATKTKPKQQNKVPKQVVEKKPTKESKEIVLQRRSVHIMDKELSLISKEDFFTILRSVSSSLDGNENAVHLLLMLHRVQDLDSGLYILIRNERDLKELQELMYKDFLWNQTEFENLYLLEQRDLTLASKAISCSQDIASDGAFSLGMLCNFSKQLQEFDAHRYKELYWECGAIGQQLYLESTSLGFSGTGIGCFLDDMFHNLLGLKDNKYQSLYHFTVGKGFVDSRIMTKPAYEVKL